MKKDIIETLEKYPDEFELDPSLTADAERLTEELYGKRKKRRFSWKWLSVATATAAVVVTVLCVVLLRPQVEVPYFGEELLYSEKVDSFDELVEQNNLSINYFGKEIQGNNFIFRFNDNTQWAYLYQELLYISDDSFDNVNLGISFQNRSFERFAEFDLLPDSQVTNQISIEYTVKEINNLFRIYAKFKQGDIVYYLEIRTADTEGKIDYYINLLFS